VTSNLVKISKKLSTLFRKSQYMTELTGLTVWGETVKKVKMVRTKNYIPASRDLG